MNEKLFYSKILSKVQEGSPHELVRFIQDNGYNAIDELDKLAIIPSNYLTNVRRNPNYIEQTYEEIDLKFFPLMYLAVLNDSYTLDMVMLLHKHMSTPIGAPIGCYLVDIHHEYRFTLNAQQEKADYDFILHAIRHKKTDLLNYLLSFYGLGKDGNPGFTAENLNNSRLFAENLINFKAQKLLFDAKDYSGLTNLIENSKLVFSILELIKDEAFVEYCRMNGSPFVNLYIENAQYAQGFQNLYDFDHNVDNPQLKTLCRQPVGIPVEIKKEIKEKSMFNNNSYAISGLAVIGALAVCCYAANST